jgi:histone deacetylase 1/2
MKLTFCKTLKFFKSYTNSNWAEDHNIKRLTSKHVFNVNNDVISWFSKRQSTMTLFICEIEYTEQILSVKKTIWLWNLMTQLTYDIEYFQTIMIYKKNENAIVFVKNLQFHARIKYIDIQIHFIKEKVIERFYWSVLRAHRSNDSWRSH